MVVQYSNANTQQSYENVHVSRESGGDKHIAHVDNIKGHQSTLLMWFTQHEEFTL